ncbi:hypothetical protein GALL_510710 [mine drainage metagenome]|uniref:Uncharacterized protein n=1 Tax=mine drainage metagenome TaxID=410659 RepID=A0A1J5PHS7_9ZZZZ
MAEQHPVSRRQRQGVAGAFLPRQVARARHQLLRLHPRELRKTAVRRLVSPDALRGREHRVAAVAFLVIAVVLVAVDHHLIADLPAFHLVAHRPNDARRIRTGDVIGRAVAIKRADRGAKRGPDAVIVNARRHHHHQHFVAVDLPGIDHLDQHRGIRLAMPFAPDRPSIHLGRDVTQGRHLAHFIEVFHRSLVRDNRAGGIKGHQSLLRQVAPHRRINAGFRDEIPIAKQDCNADHKVFVIL